MRFLATRESGGRYYCEDLHARDWDHAEDVCACLGWVLDGEFVGEQDAEDHVVDWFVRASGRTPS